jgi:septal ring factor EnvC (AmiA/AmiB activator)
MSRQHCDGISPAATGHCEDHSGQLMWMRGIASLLILSAGLLSYSVFWQAPAIQTEIAKEVARVDGEIKLVKKEMESVKSDIADLRGRVSTLEK